MERELYEDGSSCFITSDGTPISDSTIESMKDIETEFELKGFLLMGGYSDSAIDEIAAYVRSFK